MHLTKATLLREVLYKPVSLAAGVKRGMEGYHPEAFWVLGSSLSLSQCMKHTWFDVMPFAVI